VRRHATPITSLTRFVVAAATLADERIEDHRPRPHANGIPVTLRI
jgi:hypothetical protein